MTRAGLSIPSFGLKVKLTKEERIKSNRSSQDHRDNTTFNQEVERSHDRKTRQPGSSWT